MIEQNRTDPRRDMWSGVGGALDDPQVRAQRGSVRRRRRWFPRIRARIARLVRG